MALGGDQRLHVELTIHWSSGGKQKVMTLVDTGAKYILIHDSPQKFSGPLCAIDDYRRQMVMVRKAL